MRRTLLAAATGLVFGLWIGGAATGAQAPTTAGAAPRTPWGEPDLQGTWTSEAELSVPFERPREHGTRQTLTQAEMAARQATLQKQAASDNAEFDLETADTSNAGQVGSATSPPPHWLERGKASHRSSMVIDPPDGRIPPMTEEGQRRLRELRGTFAINGNFNDALFKGPEDLSLWERCITRGVPSAIFPTVYNANTQIVQAPGVVAITYEMIHDTRIIPLSPLPPHQALVCSAYFQRKFASGCVGVFGSASHEDPTHDVCSVPLVVGKVLGKVAKPDVRHHDGFACLCVVGRQPLQ
jgi:hypothetical protein